MVPAKGGHFGHFLVDVDELVVAGGVGEFVDHLLINQNPFGCADFFTHFGGEFGGGYGGHRHSS
jgi:hypothetical protein